MPGIKSSTPLPFHTPLAWIATLFNQTPTLSLPCPTLTGACVLHTYKTQKIIAWHTRRPLASVLYFTPHTLHTCTQKILPKTHWRRPLPLSQTLLVVRRCVTPLSRLPSNRGCINMCGGKGAGDTSCLWSESSHDSVSVRRLVPSQHPLPPPLCLFLIAVQRSRSAQLVGETHTATVAGEKVY